jgi:hypothetical protein
VKYVKYADLKHFREVNGVEKGKGSGRNQKLAREEAAKVASVNMGFTLV